MLGASVVSINKEMILPEAYTADTITAELASVIRSLCEKLAYKGKIIGHIKAIIRSQEEYLHISTTSLQQQTIQTSAGWQDMQIRQLVLTINVILYGYSKNALQEVLEEVLRPTIFI